MSYPLSQNAVTYSLYAHVVLDEGLDALLEYGVPEHLLSHIHVGMRVGIKVRNSYRKATVITLSSTTQLTKVSPLEEILSEKLLSEDLIKLSHWMSHYYCCSLRKIFKFLIPSSVKAGMETKEVFFIESLLSQELLLQHCLELRQKKPSQAKVLDILLKHPKGILLSKLLELSQVSQSPVNTLIKQKILHKRQVAHQRVSLEEEYFITKPKKLSEEQQLAYERVCHSIEQHIFQTHLIHGITGSGKTEIYLQAIARARALGHSALMLVPEIALTTQMIERFRSRFQEKIGIYHHRLNPKERYELWHQIRQGEIKIVLGARSAVFLPLVDLKLIIVDEEHEPSYKQSEEAPCYHGRDTAIMRGSFCSATVVLGSATPSLESYTNAKKGKYLLTTLSSRAKASHLPKITLIDMAREVEKSEGFTFFSPKLLDAIAARIKAGEQTLLFLNRRGYHSMLLCQNCHEAFKCPHCDIALTFHRHTNSLNCHYCDHMRSPPPKTCPTCGQGAPLVYRGIGTEQVEIMLKRIFPQVRTLRMDADTTRHKGSHEQLFKEFRSGKADVLIGTQMIAKGFHFPSVTLVGILNSDSALHTGDFRAAEHLFQLLVQVAGRAGRGELSGEVFLQTFLPQHKLFHHVMHQDYQAFYEEECVSRKLFVYPPFTHLAKVHISSISQEKGLDLANLYHKLLLEHLPHSYTLLPVIPDRVSRIKERYRYYFLIKGTSMASFASIAKKLLDHPLIKKALSHDQRLLIDVDPI